MFHARGRAFSAHTRTSASPAANACMGQIINTVMTSQKYSVIRLKNVAKLTKKITLY